MCSMTRPDRLLKTVLSLFVPNKENVANASVLIEINNLYEERSSIKHLDKRSTLETGI